MQAINKSFLKNMIVHAQHRTMATATGSIRDRFEHAYIARTAALAKVSKKVIVKMILCKYQTHGGTLMGRKMS